MPVHKNVSIEPKSMELADVARTEGNNFHVERSFFDTLLQYNESLCHAVTGSEAIAMVYANRSAIYFEMKLFTKSIKNAQMARENGYPEKNLSILDKRIEKCEEQIKAGNETLGDDNPFSFFKQTHGANKRLPFVANCLELKRSEKFGRFIITNRDLAVGDIVAIEKPHFRIIKSDSRYEGCQQTNKYQRCAMCFKDNLLDLFPCNDCSSSKIKFKVLIQLIMNFHYSNVLFGGMLRRCEKIFPQIRMPHYRFADEVWNNANGNAGLLPSIVNV